MGNSRAQVTRKQRWAITPLMLTSHCRASRASGASLAVLGPDSSSWQHFKLPSAPQAPWGLPSLLPSHQQVTWSPLMAAHLSCGSGGGDPACIHPFLGLSCTVTFSLSSDSSPKPLNRLPREKEDSKNVPPSPPLLSVTPRLTEHQGREQHPSSSFSKRLNSFYFLFNNEDGNAKMF